MDKIKFGQVITETVGQDGSVVIVTKGYYDGPVTVKEQIREDIKTSQPTLLTDVIKCLDVLRTDTPELVIRITKDKYGSVNIIQKTWITEKKKI